MVENFHKRVDAFDKCKGKTPPVELVSSNDLQLKDYESEGLAWLQFHWNIKASCIVADEDGVDNSLQVAAFIQWLSGSKGFRDFKSPAILLVTSKTKYGKWKTVLNEAISCGFYS